MSTTAIAVLAIVLSSLLLLGLHRYTSGTVTKRSPWVDAVLTHPAPFSLQTPEPPASCAPCAACTNATSCAECPPTVTAVAAVDVSQRDEPELPRFMRMGDSSYVHERPTPLEVWLLCCLAECAHMASNRSLSTALNTTGSLASRLPGQALRMLSRILKHPLIADSSPACPSTPRSVHGPICSNHGQLC
jgi:hypothetical protein